jgi:hypothetical protein
MPSTHPTEEVKPRNADEAFFKIPSLSQAFLDDAERFKATPSPLAEGNLCYSGRVLRQLFRDWWHNDPLPLRRPHGLSVVDQLTVMLHNRTTDQIDAAWALVHQLPILVERVVADDPPPSTDDHPEWRAGWRFENDKATWGGQAIPLRVAEYNLLQSLVNSANGFLDLTALMQDPAVATYGPKGCIGRINNELSGKMPFMIKRGSDKKCKKAWFILRSPHKKCS